MNKCFNRSCYRIPWQPLAYVFTFPQQLFFPLLSFFVSPPLTAKRYTCVTSVHSAKTHTHTTHACRCTCMQACTHACTHAHTHACTHAHAHAHTYTHTHTHTLLTISTQSNVTVYGVILTVRSPWRFEVKSSSFFFSSSNSLANLSLSCNSAAVFSFSSDTD